MQPNHLIEIPLRDLNIQNRIGNSDFYRGTYQGKPVTIKQFQLTSSQPNLVQKLNEDAQVIWRC